MGAPLLTISGIGASKTLCMFLISRQRWCSLYIAEVPSAVSSDSLRLCMGVDFWAHRFLQLQESVRPKLFTFSSSSMLVSRHAPSVLVHRWHVFCWHGASSLHHHEASITAFIAGFLQRLCLGEVPLLHAVWRPDVVWARDFWVWVLQVC